MSKILWIILSLICFAGAVFGAVMTIMAFCFMEYGRVVFYLIITLVAIEAMILILMKLKRKKS